MVHIQKMRWEHWLVGIVLFLLFVTTMIPTFLLLLTIKLVHIIYYDIKEVMSV